jgi:hypothetical protein
VPFPSIPSIKARARLGLDPLSQAKIDSQGIPLSADGWRSSRPSDMRADEYKVGKLAVTTYLSVQLPKGYKYLVFYALTAKVLGLPIIELFREAFNGFSCIAL